MTTKENIGKWLVERAGYAYCAGCITDSMNLFDLVQVRDSTRFLARNDSRFHRLSGKCFCCGKERLLIRAEEQA